MSTLKERDQVRETAKTIMALLSQAGDLTNRTSGIVCDALLACAAIHAKTAGDTPSEFLSSAQFAYNSFAADSPIEAIANLEPVPTQLSAPDSITFMQQIMEDNPALAALAAKAVQAAPVDTIRALMENQFAFLADVITKYPDSRTDIKRVLRTTLAFCRQQDEPLDFRFVTPARAAELLATTDSCVFEDLENVNALTAALAGNPDDCRTDERTILIGTFPKPAPIEVKPTPPTKPPLGLVP